MSMDEVTPGLWIGDLPSALDVEELKAHGIYSILSAMRGGLTIKETFNRHQVLLDDTEDADILRHLLPSIHFIQAELDKGRGVLVHCHAGVSRSATVVAAYLMYSRNLDTENALEMIRDVRPNIEPNQGFLRQLEIFHEARFKISRRDKTTRMYYMERALEEVMNGDGSPPETEMFAKFPHTPSDSTPNTPGAPRRRIRCKMCRHELATREHMLDHGQLGPPTPASRTPAVSRRPSAKIPHRPSMSQARPTVGGIAESRPRRSSVLADSFAMSTIGTEENGSVDTVRTKGYPSLPPRRRSSSEKSGFRTLPEVPYGVEDVASLSMSALDDESDEEDSTQAPRTKSTPNILNSSGMSDETAKMIGRRMSDAVFSPLATIDMSGHTPGEGPTSTSASEVVHTTFISPSELAAELYANPKLAGLRNPLAMSMTPMQPASKPPIQISPPILANPKCSGYFVEPMKWMEPFLETGQLAGKIICPNPKCGAKLGNYDWAGVCCGCKEWVIPGFCINRSKVDEIVK
ncbi:Tyrosine-protein phosphatase yvh1 [Hypsizygus marmoreus]|uniref:protein-tyrosine-phosphatase n=1 Tax=Hypsizygus marmoreus TaxID=39966 RepID=A0A369K698_HYPMA|nr:Tyrosine-protein phosphatase yvh1 [Hypsizygus marmoreus]